RASKSNYEFMQLMVKREKDAGLLDQLTYVTKVRRAMEAGLDTGTALVRVEDRPKQKEGAQPQNPIKGHIYFLTDGECASACLDFADLMRRLPKVVHVGLPTSADAIYIDNTYTMLPSGLAGLGYSMKVFRNRVRKNNEWYEPQSAGLAER
ncbi:S41 family peptidase, partial [bacterium]|nr:S41 family peptidase [bacterium]